VSRTIIRHVKKCARFGKDYLYKWWKIAWKNLGIEDVDLYGGTRHSSARALREHFSPEQIKKAIRGYHTTTTDQWLETSDSRGYQPVSFLKKFHHLHYHRYYYHLHNMFSLPSNVSLKGKHKGK